MTTNLPPGGTIESALAGIKGAATRLRDMATSAATSLAGPSAGSGPGRGLTIVCRSRATASIRSGVDGRQCFVVQGPLSDLEGAPIGSFRAVYLAKVFSSSDLVAYPDPPKGPFDRAYAMGEMEWTPLLNPAKSEWTFDRVGHVVVGAGVGLSRIVTRGEQGVTFWFSTSSVVSMRLRDSAVTVGQANSLATAFFPETPALVESMSFPTDVFHILSLMPTG
jgi:hypothetical protein